MIATARGPRGRRGALGGGTVALGGGTVAPGGTVAHGGAEATKGPDGMPVGGGRASTATDAIADSPNHSSPDGTKKAIGAPVASRSADDSSCFRCLCCAAAHSEAMATEADGRPIGPKVLPSAAEAVDSLTGPRDLPSVTEAVDSLTGPRELPNAAMAADSLTDPRDLTSATKATEATIGHVADRVKAYRNFCLGRGRAIQLHSCPEASRSSYPTGSHYPAHAVSKKAEPVTAKATTIIARGHDSEQAFVVHRIPH